MRNTRKVPLWRRTLSNPNISAPLSFSLVAFSIAGMFASPVGKGITTAIALSDDRALVTTLTAGLVLLVGAILTGLVVLALSLLNRPRRRS
jgi:hypothetical protein